MFIENTAQFMLFSLILMRMTGFIFLNPILGRKNIPAIAKTGFTLVLALLIYSFSRGTLEIGTTSSVVYGVLLLKELAVGFVLGFIMQIFLMVFTYAGGVIDFQIGLSMAMVYDPQNNAQIPLTGSLFNAWFMLLFFAVDGHLALMKILVTSADIVPYGEAAFTAAAATAVLDIFTQCIVLAVKLSFPFIAVEFISEIGVGILMKMIPQINVFVINIQLKLIVGVLMLMILFTPIGNFMENVIQEMLTNVKDILTIM